jgi:DNA-binding CsgD family transcriptional regulator
VAVVEAAAGLGKTRLLAEARSAGASAGLTLLSARATELEQDFPFALVRQLFGSRLAALPREDREQVLEGASSARAALGLDRQGSREPDSFAVLHGLYWVTAAMAEQGPLLIEIDDAHWADTASLDFLRFLLPRLEELPVLLVIAARPHQPELNEGLREILADPTVSHIALSPLSEKAASVLLADAFRRDPEPGFAAACHQQSGGNPFLICELARTLVEQEVEPLDAEAEMVRELAPERVAHWVLLRIRRLSPDAAGVAHALAVLGDGSDLRLVAAMAGLDLEAARGAVDELSRSAILDGDPGLHFVHPLVRNAVYADLAAAERGLAHARAAGLLRERDSDADQISIHLLATDRQGNREAVETLIEAADTASASGALRSSIVYLFRALEEPPALEQRQSVLNRLILAIVRAADQKAWAEIEADVFAELEREPSLRTRWAIPLTMAMASEGRFEEVGSMLKRAVEVAVGEGDVECAFQLEAQLRTIGMLVPGLPEVDLSPYADRIDPDSSAGRLVAAMEAGAALAGGTAKEASEAAKRALADGAIFREEPEPTAPTLALTTLVIADELDAAREAAVRSRAIAEERHATPEMIQSFFCTGFVAWAAGDFIAAEADMRQSVDLARMAGILPIVLMSSGPLVEILIERDALEEAEAILEGAGLLSGPIPEGLLFIQFLLVRIHLRFEQGDMEGAAEDAAELAARGEMGGIGDGPVAMACVWGTRALLAIGERERAEELASRTMAFLRRWGTPALVSRGICAVASVRGGAEEIAMLEEAAAMSEGALGRAGRLYALIQLGAALRRDGQRVAARAPLREALELARRCGAARFAKHARDELQATGETVRRYAPIGVESLTPSERRVAELAASGMTNRQIAQSLFVTVKTVEAHLSAAYDKLDIRSRRDLNGALTAPTS